MKTVFFEITDKKNCDITYEAGELRGTDEQINEQVKAIQEYQFARTRRENVASIYEYE